MLSRCHGARKIRIIPERVAAGDMWDRAGRIDILGEEFQRAGPEGIVLSPFADAKIARQIDDEDKNAGCDCESAEG